MNSAQGKRRLTGRGSQNTCQCGLYPPRDLVNPNPPCDTPNHQGHKIVYGKITPPIYHSIKSSHVRWPMSQVATCDQIGVTGARMWHCFRHILASVTPLWSQVATCDIGHCTCDNSILWYIGWVTEHMFFPHNFVFRIHIKSTNFRFFSNSQITDPKI